MLILFESITGYSLFFCKEEFVSSFLNNTFQNNINSYDIFSKNFNLKSFAPFRSINHALKECCRISRSMVSDYLEKFILNSYQSFQTNDSLGVSESTFAISINKKIKIKILTNETILELSRGIRLHFEKISKNFFYREISKAQCGLAHLYSQSKMKLNLEKTDSMISQSNFLLDQLDADINFFTMLSKEWYSWHFPELVNIIKDGYLFALVVKFIGNRKSLNKKKTEELGVLVINELFCKEIKETSITSIGSKIENIDLSIIEKLCSIIINLTEFRNYVNFTLFKKVAIIAPNLNQIIGEHLVAKLISKAGSLKNLTRFPSSTIQILGSEKALFKALKNKIKTPKYGILFNSNFMRQIDGKYQAKFSRYLANKCSLALRIDYFSNYSSNIYGKKLKARLSKKIFNNLRINQL
jgi:RNA processing factor Prp31|mmetsp:Transcript_79642/g.129106  ORF Transcript_79642/g.129106 Transcript_79642/m.129106 type:complete len:412 (-) Transcript_79642:1503-2738(-)